MPSIKNLFEFLKKIQAGKNKRVIKIIFKEKNPKLLINCKFSLIDEKLQIQRFHGNPVKTMLLAKSPKPKRKLIKKIDDMFSLIKYPDKIIGIEKNSDKNRGIKINPKGIKILN